MASTDIDRPRSNRAQIFQACFTSIQMLASLALLALAIYTYQHTIVPVQKVYDLEEKKISAERRLKEVEDRLSQYQSSVRDYVVDQFILRIYSEASVFTAPVFEFAFLGNLKPRLRDQPRSAASLYRNLIGRRLFPDGTDIVTGAEIIAAGLRSPEFDMLTEDEKRSLTRRVEAFVSSYTDRAVFAANLAIAGATFATVDIRDHRAMEEYLAASRVEQARHFAAHEAFVKAVGKLRDALRAA